MSRWALFDAYFIPIFVELKNINEKEDDYNLEDLIFDSLKNLNFTLEKELFIESLNSGRYVLFLDGYDEVKEKKKVFISQEISRVTNKYQDNHYFVSSRKNSMLERGWDNFCDFTVEPLTKQKAIELLQNLEYDVDVKEKFILQLSQEGLFEKHQSFCSNPLLLTIMLLTYQEFAEIPDKIHIFYGRAFDVLYAKHDAGKGSFVREKFFEKNGLAYDDFQNALSAFSAISYLNSITTFEKDLLIEYIRQAKDFTGLSFDSNDFSVDLSEAVCILTLDGAEYKYQHRSFQEYFTAKFINSLTDEEQKDYLFELAEQNPGSLHTDTVFSMLFEINRVKLEKNFLIPMLEEIKSLIEDSDKDISALKFLDLSFKSVTIGDKSTHGIEEQHNDVSKKNRLSAAFTLKLHNIRYMYTTRFVNNKYMKIMQEDIDFDTSDWLQENSETRLKHYSEMEEIYNRRISEKRGAILDINNYMTNPKQDNDDILTVSRRHIHYLKYSLLILEKLKERHSNRKSIRDLFSRKDKSYV
ncbi:hypothetical protein MKZ02_12680 [Pseudobacillus sp. FSL P4-0506]|uniref:NACHT domain-containing protein n=1 Tax=Pseudobacillus sp. FSL P4-0506 TaxID=2921576 RepID=UPI0030F9BCC5